MNYRIIRNDILKNKVITLTTSIFIAVAAMLVSLAAILVVNLTGALNTLMVQSETAHFMQMHSGEIDNERLSTFADQNGNVDEFQVLEFLGIDGAQIQFEKGSLGGSMQDNGLSVQSEKFDYLLDLHGNIISAKNGELYVPICYMRDNTTKVGDKVVICGKEFRVAGFLRDSQMNSTLSSSKRFLVSHDDFAEMKNLGSMEYLIEFRLMDMSELGAFETAYISSGLEANGPTITYQLFKTLNAFSDGMMIGVILIISLLVVLITFMCIRLTLLAKIEDDYREIGVMIAIGLRVLDIKKIYLVKYAAIGFISCMIGYVFSLAFQGILTQNIRTYMGESDNSSTSSALGLFGVLLVFLAIIAYVNGVLSRFRKISTVEAIRFGNKQEKSTGTTHFCLSQNKLFNTNVFLGIKDVFARKRLYATMLAVLVIASFIMIVPQNIYNTISAKGFGTYLGIGNCDLRIDIQQTDNISKKTTEIEKAMNNDNTISKVVVLTTKIFKTNSDESIKVELGDHSIFPVAYSKGRAPVAGDEIALSSINADELSKQVGDVITLMVNGREQYFTICGLYSDVTNGGKTAKAAFNDDSANIMWSIIYGSLIDPGLIGEITSEYADRFPFAKVSGIDEYIKQTFGQTISSAKTASYTAIAIALMITILVTMLFMKMLVTKDRYSIAIMKAFGFTNSDIKVQYVVRSVFVLIMGILFGTFLANTLGDMLAGIVISSFGASSFKFTINPISAYLLCPLMMMCSVLIATILGTLAVGQIKISENIKE